MSNRFGSKSRILVLDLVAWLVAVTDTNFPPNGSICISFDRSDSSDQESEIRTSKRWKVRVGVDFAD